MKIRIGKTAAITFINGLIVLLCLLLVLSAQESKSLQALSLTDRLFDFNIRSTMKQEPHGDILVIGIDTESIKEVGPYPWDRKVYADLIDRLEEGGAKVIAFDIELYTESNNPDSDKVLAETLAKYDNIILPSHAVLENEFDRVSRGTGGLIKAADVEQPIPLFREHVLRAHINAAFSDDGIIRSNYMQIDTPEGVFPTLALAMADAAGVNTEAYLHLPKLQGKPESEMIIRWDNMQNDFETIPFARVLDGSVPKEVFQDRLILVGYTAPGSDQGSTPIEKHMNLVYAHANILNQILDEAVITYSPAYLPYLLLIIAALVVGILTWRLKAITGVITVFALLALMLAGQYWLFASKSQFLDVTGAVIFGVVVYLVNIAIKTYFETKQKNYITKQFGRYISPELVKEIASSEQEIQLGGISKELTILFLDVRGFTPLSEKLKPEEVVDFLNMMFDLITDRALKNHGTIDKFIGDAAMILYNAPLDVPNHPYFAVKTAYEIQQGMEKVRAEVLEKYGVTISCGIGINTGDVVVGNIGSYLRVDYTAIGDNVNTAARIESNTEPNQILVSEATYELTKEAVEYEYAGEKLMKGKSVPLKLYEVKSIKERKDESTK